MAKNHKSRNRQNKFTYLMKKKGTKQIGNSAVTGANVLDSVLSLGDVHRSIMIEKLSLNNCNVFFGNVGVSDTVNSGVIKDKDEGPIKYLKKIVKWLGPLVIGELLKQLLHIYIK